MPIKKQIAPGERVPLKLTVSQRNLIRHELILIDPDYVQIVQATPLDEPIMMSLDDLEDFAGYIAAEANHTEDKAMEGKLDRIFDRCQRMLDRYTDEVPLQS